MKDTYIQGANEEYVSPCNEIVLACLTLNEDVQPAIGPNNQALEASDELETAKCRQHRVFRKLWNKGLYRGQTVDGSSSEWAESANMQPEKHLVKPNQTLCIHTSKQDAAVGSAAAPVGAPPCTEGL